jgi:hypothetical protein
MWFYWWSWKSKRRSIRQTEAFKDVLSQSVNFPVLLCYLELVERILQGLKKAAALLKGRKSSVLPLLLEQLTTKK